MTAMNLSPAPDGPSPEITLESALAELDELLEEIPIWTPEPGDQIDGLFVEYTQGTSKFDGKPLVIGTLRTAGGFVRIFVSQAVLKRLFREWKPQLGERVRIRRLADKTTTKAKLFSMRVVGRPPSTMVPDFGAGDVTQAVPPDDDEMPPPDDHDRH